MKKYYKTPIIEKIIIDNEISLVLTTPPPKGPGEDNFNPEETLQESPWE